MPIEEWDDKNLNNGDGCSSTCKIEYGFYWTGGSMTQVDVWKEIWGDGVVIGDKANKYLNFFLIFICSVSYISSEIHCRLFLQSCLPLIRHFHVWYAITPQIQHRSCKSITKKFEQQ